MQGLRKFTLLVDPSKDNWRDFRYSSGSPFVPPPKLTNHLLQDLCPLEKNGVLIGVKVEGDSKRAWVYRRRKAGVQEYMTLEGEGEEMEYMPLREEDITWGCSH